MGYLLVLLAGIGWGTIGIFGKVVLTYGLSSFDVAWLRGAVSLLELAPIVIIMERGWPKMRMKDLLLFASYGLINGTVYNILYFKSVELVGASVAVVLTYTAPMFAVILARLIFHERISVQKVIAIVTCLAGCFLVVGGYDSVLIQVNTKGLLVGLVGGIAFSFYGVFAKMASARGYSPLATVFYYNLFGTLFLTLLRTPQAIVFQTANVSYIVTVLAMGACSGVIPWVAYNKGIKQVEVGRAAIIASVEAVVGVALAVLMLGEELNYLQFIGTALVVGGALLAQVERSSVGLLKGEPSRKPGNPVQ